MEKEIKPGMLAYVDTDKVLPNPHNPRHLFDKKPLKILKGSIKNVGILTPLIVYERKRDKQLIILDGQRRWACAKELELPKIPVNIIEEPSLITNLVTMFNIHNIRESWELMPTALKLEVIMRELKKKISEPQLSALTGLSKPNIHRCKILLTYDKKYQDLMLSKNPEDRLKPDFFIEMYSVLNLIEKRLLHVAEKYSRDDLIQVFLDKYLKGTFTNVIHFRRIANIIRGIKKGVPVDRIEEIILKMITDEKFEIENYEKTTASVYAYIDVKKTISGFSLELSKIKFDYIEYDKGLHSSLIKLRDLIDEKISEMEHLKGG